MTRPTYKFYLALIAIFSFSIPLSTAQITVDNTLTVEEYVTEFLIGEGVEVTNITFNGMPGDQVSVYVGSFQNATDEISLEEGMIMASGGVTGAEGPNESGSSSVAGNSTYSDGDLEQAANSTNLNDVAVVEFDFVPQGDSIKFNYVWASEEYPEFVNSYNDIFGFFLSGPGINGPYSGNAENIAIVPGTNLPVSINNINNGNDGVSGPCVNCEFYIDNNYDFGGGPTPFNIQFDGFTVPLQAAAEVQCGQTYHIKLAIADALDTGFDSAIFLENNSFTSPEIINVSLGTGVDGDNNVYESCPSTDLIFSRAPGGGDDWVEITYGGNAEAGVDYAELPDSLFFAEGTNEIILDLDVFEDGVAEGVDSLTMSVINYVECTDDFIETNFTIYLQDELEGEIVEDDFVLGSCSETFTLTSYVYAGRPEITYEWTDDNGNVLSTDEELTTQLNQETTYTLTISDECDAEVTDEITVTPGDLPVIDNIPNTVEVTCVDTTSFFPEVTGGLGEYTYSWLVDGAEQSSDSTFTINVDLTTDVVLIVTDECSAADTVTTTLEYQPTPISIDIGEDVDASCVDQIVLFPEIEGGEVPYSYLWQVDTLVYDSTAQITVQSYETVQVTLFMEEACGYTAQDSMIINIPDNPIDVTPVEDTLICFGTPATLSAIAEGGEGGFEYFWSPAGLEGQQVEVWPEEPTVYEVTAVDICEDSASAEVEVDIDFVQASIDRQLITDTDIQFAGGSVPPCENCSYEWDFGDGGSSSSQNPLHSFDGLREYVTELTVTTEIGCTSSTTINIDPPVSIYIPNAFSPNGDGINEFFKVESQGIKKFEMYIFNRWGDVVFKTGNPNDKWLGEVNDGNHYALNNTYTYMITYEGVNEVEQTKTGTITIIR